MSSKWIKEPLRGPIMKKSKIRAKISWTTHVTTLSCTKHIESTAVSSKKEKQRVITMY